MRDHVTTCSKKIQVEGLSVGNQMAPIRRGTGPMIASIIFVFSLGALGQFAVSWCRTILVSYNKVELSSRVREIVEGSSDLAGPDFDSLLQLLRFAPRLDDDGRSLRAVIAYYRVARLGLKLVSPFSRQAKRWFEGELCLCSHFAAVALDRRLAMLER